MKTLPALTASLVLAGCTVFPVPEPPRFMELAPATELPAFEQPVPVSLRIDTPLASNPVDSTRILVKPTAYEFQALSGARWRESIPVVVRDHLIEALRASGGFENVMNDTSPASSNVTLVSELAGFHAENRENGGEVVISLHLQLMDNRTRQSLCVRDYETRTYAQSTGLEDLMVAFSDAAEQASNETIAWAYECLAGR